MENVITFAVQSHETMPREVSQDAVAWLRRCGADVDLVARLELVLVEVLNNIVEHGYDAPRVGPVRILLSLSGGKITCEVMDSGREWPRDLVRHATMPDIAVDFMDTPEGGFGWALIRIETEWIQYRRETLQNNLSFRVGSIAE